MTYTDIIESLKRTLNLSGSDDVHLLRELNLFLAEVCQLAPFVHLVGKIVDHTYATGSPIAVPADKVGIMLVSSPGVIYWYAQQGLIPTGLGMSWWAYDMADRTKIRLYDDDGVEIVGATVAVTYWTKETALVTGTLSTANPYPGTDALLLGMITRWNALQEHRTEEAAALWTAYEAAKAEIKLRAPRLMVPAKMRGGLVIAASDRD